MKTELVKRRRPKLRRKKIEDNSFQLINFDEYIHHSNER
jgi:hypothetical protein